MKKPTKAQLELMWALEPEGIEARFCNYARCYATGHSKLFLNSTTDASLKYGFVERSGLNGNLSLSLAGRAYLKSLAELAERSAA